MINFHFGKRNKQQTTKQTDVFLVKLMTQLMTMSMIVTCEHAIAYDEIVNNKNYQIEMEQKRLLLPIYIREIRINTNPITYFSLFMLDFALSERISLKCHEICLLSMMNKKRIGCWDTMCPEIFECDKFPRLSNIAVIREVLDYVVRHKDLNIDDALINIFDCDCKNYTLEDENGSVKDIKCIEFFFGNLLSIDEKISQKKRDISVISVRTSILMNCYICSHEYFDE